MYRIIALRSDFRTLNVVILESGQNTVCRTLKVAKTTIGG